MTFDIPAQIGAVTRSLARGERGGRPTRVLVATRTYPTDVEDLWDAITSAERIPRWFLPITGDLRLGGRYQLQGNAGGEITRCDRPHHLAVTWEMRGDVSWVDVRLSAEDRGARLELTHEAVVPEELWGQFGPGGVGIGWDLGLLGLYQYLTSREAVDPAKFAAWSASEEGKGFMRGSSDGWCQASIADGTDAAQAKAAAATVLAMYTGGEGEAGHPA